MNQSIISHSLVAILFLAVGGGVGYAIGTSGTVTPLLETIPAAMETEDTTSDAPADTAGDTPAESGGDVTVSANNLTESQAALARTFGIDPNNVTLTAEMIACAEAKLGVARVEEITNGATPSFTEGVKLAGCYTSN